MVEGGWQLSQVPVWNRIEWFDLGDKVVNLIQELVLVITGKRKDNKLKRMVLFIKVGFLFDHKLLEKKLWIID